MLSREWLVKHVLKVLRLANWRPAGKAPKKSLETVMAPRPGYVLNPLLKYPRNWPCWCGSQRKAKKCCLPTTAHAVDAETGRLARGYMKACGL